ncbi:copper resistance protein B (plasmid) [Azospirillum oryzae]|uniref:Copper resistance protein B n=1 Tax=Azospirillum oryzae TaxID=286727 RepID=A0A6N1AUA7_9PROT|nr:MULTISPECIES: copper resistance protein B [Azospirillum]KAA0585395.1 copper resistance protein B [Azospirillum oryzae]QCG99409.1 copper resistance protein B [Azospirillum sp. TSA2s]QKS54818.1 copper resistance protein B [Azospirillum oryzae]GLR77409.1 hypothetical protein GCM10007856_00770 [Azospirillum oryzae]
MRMITSGLRRVLLLAGALTLVVTATAANAADPPHAQQFHEEPAILSTLLVDRLEHRWKDGENTLDWDIKGFIGGDTDKLWLNAKGSKPVEGGAEKAEFQLLYSRLVSEFWDVQVGVRHDVRPQPQTTYAVAGFQGLAPYFFDVNAQAFLSEDGALSARLEAEYDLLITQRLILQPVAEMNVSARRVRELDLGRGITDIELGLRLRYEVAREFAPYIGVNWERKLGETADITRRHGEDASAVSFVTGVRFWF